MNPAWPFDPEPGRLPSAYAERFFGRAWPLGQDAIAWAMAMPCDSGCEALHGPSPIFGDTLGRQLDALHCDYVFTYPATHPERVRWVESQRFHDTAPLQWRQNGAVLDTCFEVARLPTTSAGLAVVEEVDTYIRIDNGAGPVTRILVAGVRSDFLTAGAPQQGASITDPFPFPLQIGPGVLTVRWQLVHQWVDETASRGVAWAVNVPERQAVPSTYQPRPPWRDNRYGWGGRVGRDKQWEFEGYGLVRLFCTLTVTPSGANWSQTVIRVGGGLKGYWQLAGRDAVAARNATHRA